MMAKKKKVPAWLKGRLAARLYQSVPGVIATNWLNQGLLYMAPSEAAFKALLEGIYLIGWALLLRSLGLGWMGAWGFGLLLAHTGNWLTNGHLFNLLRFVGLSRQGLDFSAYAEGIRTRLAPYRCVHALALFGSASRGGLRAAQSDLDVRVIAAPGLLNEMLCCALIFRERFLALLRGFPIDIYLLTHARRRSGLRADEEPVVLLDRDAPPRGEEERA